MATPVLRIHLFSGFAAEVDGSLISGISRRKSQWLLALLALRLGREVSREWLAETLWPESDPSRALRNLRQSLTDDLRPALGASASLLRAPTKATLCLDASEVWVDVHAFDAAIQKGMRDEGGGMKEKPSDSSLIPHPSSLEEAVALYRGSLLPECLEEWVLPEREAREQSYLATLETLAAFSLERGEPAAAVRWQRLLLATDPYRESASRALMQALADCGDMAAITQVYRDLRLRLHRDLNANPAPETEALYRNLFARETRPLTSLPLSPSPAGPPRRLPVPLSDLIGRKAEIEEVCGWLGRNRLVTLVGTGGVGKTRLSIAVAEAVLPQFENGVWFVDLAPLMDPALVVQTVLRALEVKEEPSRPPEETLKQALASRTLLLVLDNCEHLMDACASLTYRLLSTCPGLRVLATSREALGLTGEHIYRVPSLSLPPIGQPNLEKSASALLEYEAVRLFVERARQSNASFQLSRNSAGTVVQICQRLDGIPLAIEMAAARVNSLSVTQIAARLEDRFALLTGGSRAALPRQRTLQAAIDWSYDLLSEEERLLFRQLCVFAGGWSLEAAEAVCAGGSLPQGEVLDVLTQLVEKSLVVFEESGKRIAHFDLSGTRQQGDSEGLAEAGEARYRLLETVRQYASARLKESEENAAVRGRHRDYFTAFAEEARRGLVGSRQLAWSQQLEVEHDNIRGAIAWCQDDPEGAEAGLRLTSAMGWFWLTHGNLKEGRQHLEDALTRDSSSWPRVRGEALIIASMLACQTADYATAQPLLEENLAIWRELGDRKGIVEALTALGTVKHEQGDHATAHAYLEERLAMQQVSGDRQNSANTLYWLGRTAEAQGDLAKARLYLEEACAIDLEFGQRAGHAAWRLGDVLCMLGDYTAARAWLSESLKTAWELDDKVVVFSSLEFLAWLAHSHGQSEQAARLYGAADGLRTTFGYRLSPSDQNKHEARTTTVRAAMGEAAFTVAWEKGRAMSAEQMVEYALT